MVNKKIQSAIKVVSAVLGGLLGLGVYIIVNQIMIVLGYGGLSTILPVWINTLVMLFLITLFGIILYIISPKLAELIMELEKSLKALPDKDLFMGAIGLVVGLIIAYLLSGLVDMVGVSWISVPLSITLYVILGYMGIAIALNKLAHFNFSEVFKKNQGILSKVSGCSTKVLDTSAIIDGRIYEIAKTGFIEGTIVIPQFVLTELRHIADSADELKRNRGRRGLDILKAIQNDLEVKVEVSDKDYGENMEVDAKLIKLCTEIDARVVTNDYNLNKVALVQGVKVLNVNELSNAVKPVALPGETMEVKIVKEGKEQQQGVAFLGDGTMIVVQEARDRIGELLMVEVTSSLQTSAGRMIFARIID